MADNPFPEPEAIERWTAQRTAAIILVRSALERAKSGEGHS
jgi:hypothetical protein